MTEHCDLNHAPIGVFDSGVGGLTVAREIMRQIPDERIVYFGDTARVPYGSKSPNTIIRYSRQIIRFLRIHRENKDAQVMGRACPLFVPLVEEGWIKDPVTVAVAERYLQPFKESDIDTLILGCTHYPLLR